MATYASLITVPHGYCADIYCLSSCNTSIAQFVNTKLDPTSSIILVNFFLKQDILVCGLAQLKILNVRYSWPVAAFCNCSVFCDKKSQDFFSSWFAYNVIIKT